MRNWGSRTATPQAGDHSANYGLVFPPLSGDKPTKRQMREASLASVPLDISSSYETVNQEDRNLSSAERVENNLSSATDDATPGISTVETEPQEQNFQSAQTGTQEHNLLTPSTVVQTGNIKKDWLPADDAKTCPDLLPTEAQTDVVDRQGRFLSQRKKRVECFTKYYADGGELTEEETTVAQKQDSSSSSVKGTMSATKIPAGSSTTTLSANLNTTTRGSSCETLSLALFPSLTGEKQSKKQMRNAHLQLPKLQHE